MPCLDIYIYIVSACFFIYNLYKLYIPEPFNMGRLDAVFKGLRTGLETCADEKIRTFLLSLPFAAGLCIYIDRLRKPLFWRNQPFFLSPHPSEPISQHHHPCMPGAGNALQTLSKDVGEGALASAIAAMQWSIQTTMRQIAILGLYKSSTIEFPHFWWCITFGHSSTYTWIYHNRFCWCQVAETN